MYIIVFCRDGTLEGSSRGANPSPGGAERTPREEVIASIIVGIKSTRRMVVKCGMATSEVGGYRRSKLMWVLDLRNSKSSDTSSLLMLAAGCHPVQRNAQPDTSFSDPFHLSGDPSKALDV